MAFRCARHLFGFSEEHKTFPLQGIQTTAGIRPDENSQQRLAQNAGPTFTPVVGTQTRLIFVKPLFSALSFDDRDAIMAMDGSGGSSLCFLVKSKGGDRD